MKSTFNTVFVFLLGLLLLNCGGSSSDQSSGDQSSDDVDLSSLPDDAPSFERLPFSFPNDLETDLEGVGVFNLSSDCDIIHYGWDFMPHWESYTENQVPVVAVADGIVSNIVLQSTNTYQDQEHNTYVIWLAIAQEVVVHYTFEPFITFGITDAEQWLTVSIGDHVLAGDVMGYLPKVEGNLGDNLIHIDWKIGTGSDESGYVCPLDYFSETWRETNEAILTQKISGSCAQLCYE